MTGTKVLKQNKNNLWNQQITYTNSKLQKSIGIISKIRYYLPNRLIRSIYFAFFQPHLNYGIINWGCANATTLSSIEICQNKILRIMSFSDHDSPCNPIFKDYKILNFKKHLNLN